MWLKNKFSKFIFTYRYSLLLLLLFLFHVINNYIIINQDNLPFIYDQRTHYIHAVEMYQVLSNPSLNLKEKMGILFFTHNYYYPFLRFWLTLPFFFIFGVSPKIALLSNLLYLFILIYAVYGIGFVLKDKFTGFIASFLVSFYPCILGFSRVYMLDLPITTLVTLAIYIMLKSEYFQNKRYTFLLGITIAFSLLHKQTFLIYFTGPFLLYFLQTIYKYKKITFGQIVYLFLIPSLIALPWYLNNFLGQLYFFKAGNFPFKTERLINLITFIYSNLKNYQLYPFLTYLFYLCLFLYLIKKYKHKIIILTWLISPIPFFILYTFEDSSRHTLPAIPASGIIIACVLNNLCEYINVNKKFLKLCKSYILTCLFIFCIMQFFFINYKKDKSTITTFDFEERLHQEGMLYPCKFNYKGIDEALDLIMKDIKEEKNIILGLDMRNIFTELLEFKIISENLKRIKILNLFSPFFLKNDKKEGLKINFKPEYFDYILIAEPIEKFGDIILFYEKFPYKSQLCLTLFIYWVFEKSKIKLSLEEAEKIIYELAKEIENSQNQFILLKKIELPKSIFKEKRYPINYYLYKRINP